MDKTQNASISLKGNPVSRGIAAGRVFWYEPFVPDIKECHIEAAGTEAALRKYEEAVAAARKELQDVYESLKEEDEHRAGIFLAHMEILEDEMLDEEIRSAIGESLSEPGWAAERVYSNYAKLLGDPRAGGGHHGCQEPAAPVLPRSPAKEFVEASGSGHRGCA